MCPMVLTLLLALSFLVVNVVKIATSINHLTFAARLPDTTVSSQCASGKRNNAANFCAGGGDHLFETCMVQTDE